MRPIAPRTGAHEVVVAEEQEEYMPLTVSVYRYEDGSTGLLTRWTFTAEERKAIAIGEDVYVMQMTNGAMAPMIVRTGPGDFTLDSAGTCEPKEGE